MPISSGRGPPLYAAQSKRSAGGDTLYSSSTCKFMRKFKFICGTTKKAADLVAKEQLSSEPSLVFIDDKFAFV